MTRHNLQFGRVLRIPIGLDDSCFRIFALFTWLLAQSYYPAEFKNRPSLLCWLMGDVTEIALFASVLWNASIGWFLANAVSANVQEVMFQGLLAGHTVAPAVNSHCAG